MLMAMGWSEARVKAYMNKDNNPNAYYYRFNDVGEVQGKGKFKPAEKKTFKELIAKGVDYRWGLFSMQFPGNVAFFFFSFFFFVLLLWYEGMCNEDNYGPSII